MAHRSMVLVSASSAKTASGSSGSVGTLDPETTETLPILVDVTAVSGRVVIRRIYLVRG